MRQSHGERAILRILPRRELHLDSQTRFSRHFARVVVKGETFAGVSTSHEPQSATVALTIHVTDVNEQPVLPPLVTVAVDENSVHDRFANRCLPRLPRPLRTGIIITGWRPKGSVPMWVVSIELAWPPCQWWPADNLRIQMAQADGGRHPEPRAPNGDPSAFFLSSPTPGFP